MPHAILEASANVMETNGKISQILIDCQEVLVERLPAKLENCKSRAILHDIYVLGKNEPDSAFVHLTVKVLKGRSPQLLKEVSLQLQQILKEGFHKSKEHLQLAISVEIAELNDSYAPFI